MRNLLLFLTAIIIYNCSPSQKTTQNQEPQINKEEIFRKTLFSDNWYQFFDKEDSIISFSYNYYENNPKAEFLRVFISRKNNNAIIYRHGYKKHISNKNPSINQFPIRNPFTGQVDTVHIFQNDTINLNKIKWERLKKHIEKYPIEEYSEFIENIEPKETHGEFCFYLPSTKRFVVFRNHQIMEDEFQEMCKLLLEMVNVNNIPLERTTINIDTKEKPLSVFENLAGGIWEINSKWVDGTEFNQLHKYEWSLEQNIVKAKIFNIIKDDYCEGEELKSEGIRAFNTKDKQVNFWDFDTRGNISNGICKVEGNNLEYIYQYNGKIIHDKWIFINPNKYEFVIEAENDGVMEVLLKGEFIRKF